MSDSIWKKEISFSRKPKAAQPEPEAVADAPKQSIWKKELALPRKKSEDARVAELVELATRTVDPSFAPGAVEPVTPPTQVAEAVVAATALPMDPVVPAPVAPVPVAPAPVAPAPVAPAPVAPAPVESWTDRQPPQQAPQQAEAWLAEPQLPPAPEAETAVIVHPPVPAADLPPLPDAKQRFWKKELSFSRKPKQQAPVVAAPVDEAPAPVTEARPTGEKVPFWKKELGRNKKEKAPKEPRARRGLSLPQISLPQISLPSRGGHQVKRVVGLKIGGSQIAAARVANNGSAELLQVARADLEPGIVIAGELRDPDSLASALQAFFAANKLPRKNVRLGIASNRIGVRTFDIAGIDDPKQLENAVHFRAQEALPIPLDEAVLDYHVLEERVDAEGTPTKRVLLVVAYRELVDRYVLACRKAGITLSGIDLEAFALLRALSAPRAASEPGDAALVAVAIGHDRATFAVSDGRVCEFTRVLEWGGASLNVAIARALNLAPSEVEPLKRVLSLSSKEVPEGVAADQYTLAVDAVRKQVQVFARELVSSLQFYQNQPGSLGIGEIVITGGTASLAGLADELQRLIGVHVHVGNPLARLKIAKKVAVDDRTGSLAVAIGLGIED